jgi:hypothetical protein
MLESNSVLKHGENFHRACTEFHLAAAFPYPGREKFFGFLDNPPQNISTQINPPNELSACFLLLSHADQISFVPDNFLKYRRIIWRTLKKFVCLLSIFAHYGIQGIVGAPKSWPGKRLHNFSKSSGSETSSSQNCAYSLSFMRAFSPLIICSHRLSSDFSNRKRAKSVTSIFFQQAMPRKFQ